MSTGFDSWPTKKELQVSGVSMIIAHILILIAAVLVTINYEIYEVNNNDDVIAFHAAISSDSNRFEVKVGVVLCWIALPLLLIQNYSFRKLLVNLHPEANIFGYLFDRAYIIWIIVITIIIPSLALVSVLHDWDYDQTNHSGYYNQLQCVVLELELIDCASVADSIVNIIPFCILFFNLFKARNGDQSYKEMASLTFPGANKKWCTSYLVCFVPVLLIIMTIFWLMIIFEFAESGIMSFDSPLKIALLIVFIWKIRLGIWLIWISKRIERIQSLTEEQKPLVDEQQYEMNTATTTKIQI